MLGYNVGLADPGQILSVTQKLPVAVGTEVSDTAVLNFGLPQGSVILLSVFVTTGLLHLSF